MRYRRVANFLFWGATISAIFLIGFLITIAIENGLFGGCDGELICLRECHLSENSGRLWLLLSLIGSGLTFAILKTWRELTRTDRYIKTIQNRIDNGRDDIRIFSADRLNWAFSAGLIRPRIFVSTGLIKILSRRELEMVICHERYHCEQRDVLKMIVLNFVARLFFFLPIFHFVRKLFTIVNEKAADLYAVSDGGDAIDLATALTKLIKNNNNLTKLNFASVTEGDLCDRVQTLIGVQTKQKTDRIFLISIIFSIVLLFGLLFPIRGEISFAEACQTECQDLR